jgi:Protein of unknown function (DUF3606)
MPDDKSKRGGADRDRVASGEPYEVAYFAKKHGLTQAQATRILKDAGTSREKADAIAEAYKKRTRR